MQKHWFLRTLSVFLIAVLLVSSVPFTNLAGLDGFDDFKASAGYEEILASFKMDLAFVVDTTGSMGGEIETAKDNMQEYIEQLELLGIDYRVAIVDYRDFPDRTGDYEDYPYSIISDFSSDADELQENVENMGLGYGGDNEETLYSALIDGLSSLEWRIDAARVAIVIGDACPLDPEPYTGYTFDDAIASLLGGNASVVEEGHEDEFKPTRNHIYVFTICRGGSEEDEFFQRLSRATLGKFYSYYSTDDMDEFIRDIINHVSELSIGIFQSYLNPIAENEYGIFVVDSYGNAVSGATVTWDGETKVTTGDGFVTFDERTVGQPVITVSKEGYVSYSNEGTNYEKNKRRYDIITLYTQRESALKLKSAFYRNGSGGMHDLLTKTKKINASNRNSFDLDDGKFSIYCKAVDEAGATRYEIIQNDNVIATSANGNFEKISVDSFEEDESVLVRVYDAKGTYVQTPINLVISKSSPVDKTKWGIESSVAQFAVPDDIPFVGGSTLSFKLPDIDWDIYMEGSTLHVGYNTKIKELSTEMEEAESEEEKKNIKERFDEYKKELSKTMETVKKYSGQELSKSNKDKLKEMMAKDKNLDFPVVGKVKVDFVGYGEIDFGESKDGKLSSGKINLCLAIDFSADKTWQTVVWVVPVVVNIEVGANVSSTVEFEHDVETDTLNAEWKANFKPRLEAFGGVGVGKAIGVGATGSANMDIEFQILSTIYPTGFNSVDLTGELGVKAYLACLTYEKPFAYHTWNLYSRTASKSIAPSLSAGASAGDMYDMSSYEIADIDYLSDESQWLAASKKIKPSMSGGYSETYNSMLVNTYRNAQPISVTNGEDTVMVFIGAGEGRDVYNLPTLKYSVYNSSTDTWSEPCNVDTNNTMDQTSYLYAAEDEIYLVYVDSEKVFESEEDVLDFTEYQSVAVSRFDSATDSFSTPEVVAGADGKYNSVPEITVINGVPTVVWQTNSNTDAFGVNQTNEICYSQYVGGQWTEGATVKASLNSVVGMATGEIAGAGSIAYVIDSDNDLNTVEDRVLYVTDFAGNSTEILSGVVANPVYAKLPGQTGTALVTYHDNNLSVYDGESVQSLYEAPIGSFTDKYVVLSDRILYLGATENSSNIFALVYDNENGKWLDSVQLTNQDKYIDSFDVFQVDGKTVSTMTRKDVEISDESIEDDCELCWLTFETKTDIVVGGTDYDKSAVVPGETIALDIDVTNNGDAALDKLQVIVTDSSGNETYNSVIDAHFVAGEYKTVTIDYPVASEISLAEYTVTVLPATGDDVNTADNSATVSIGYTDVSVETESIKIGNNYFVTAVLTNESYVPASGSVGVYNYALGEEAIAATEFEALGCGESLSVMFPVDRTTLGSDEGIITVKANSSTPEFYEYNNESSTLVSVPSIIHADRVAVSTENKAITCGGTTRVTATVYPEEAVSKEVIWTSSDESIATVSQDGVVTAQTEGTVTITATTVDGGFSSDVEIYVSHNLGTVSLETDATATSDGVAVRTCEDCGVAKNYPVKYLTLGNSIYADIEKDGLVVFKFECQNYGEYGISVYSDYDSAETISIYDANFQYIGNTWNPVLDENQVYYIVASFNDPERADQIELYITCNEYLCYHRDVVDVEPVEKTCTTDGYSAGRYCNDCDTWLEEREVYPAGHVDADYDEACDVCSEYTNTNISVNETVTVRTTDTGYVYLKFVPTETARYAFRSISSYDTYGVICDSDFNTLVTDDDDGDSGNFYAEYTLEAGQTYYMGASLYGGGYATFDVTLEKICEHEDVTEVDAVEATCQAPGYTEGVYCNDCERWISGHEEITVPHTDADYNDACDMCSTFMKSNIAVGEKATVTTIQDGYVYLRFIPTQTATYVLTSEASFDTYAILCNSEFETITSNDDDGVDSNFYIEYTLEAGQTYYWGVRRYNNEPATFDVTLTKICYHSNTTNYPATEATCQAPGYTEGTQCNDCGGWISGHQEVYGPHTDADKNLICDICATTIRDYIRAQETVTVSVLAGETVLLRFVPEVSGTYEIFSESNQDTYGHIYDSENNMLCYNDDSGDGNNFSMVYDFVAGETYYIGCRYYSSSRSGAYNVTLRESGNSHIHTYTDEVVTKATCTAEGTREYTCSECGFSFTEVIASLGHDYSDTFTIDKKATCKTTGSKSRHCTRRGCKAKTDVTEIARTSHRYKTTTTNATLTKNGKKVKKCTVCGNVAKTVTIYRPSKITISKTTYTYNGKVQKPTVKVVDAKGNKLKNGEDYTVKYSKGCKSTGKYTVKITFKGDYTGTKKLTYKILPSRTSKISVTPSTTYIKATWNKVTGADGYKVYLYKGSKLVSSKVTTKRSHTFKKLSKGTEYKVVVKAYKTIDKKKVYSSVSKSVVTATKPATPAIKVTAGKSLAKLSWKKITGATGYEIKYATNSSFKSAKSTTVKKGSTAKATIKKLKKGKKYYFKVRAYKVVDGKKIYGSYSSVKSATIK